MGEQHLNVVDTPGLFDTECSVEATLAKIGEVLNYCSYGVQAILLVIGKLDRNIFSFVVKSTPVLMNDY